MGLSAFDFLSSFAGGVQERAQEYDEALATRIKELADKGPSDITKTKYAEDYKNYTADKKLAQYLFLFATNVMSSADLTREKSSGSKRRSFDYQRGIYHFSLGQNSGIVKNIQFSKNNNILIL